jgi:thiol-disulfide isomerase/thioredoxin
MQRLHKLTGLLILCLPAWLPADQSVTSAELEAVREVQKLLQLDQLPAAETELSQKLKQFPQSARVHALHMNFAYAYRRAGEHDSAFAHMQKLVRYYLEASGRQPEFYRQLANALDSMAGYGQVAEKSQSVSEQFQHALSTLQARYEDHRTDPVLGAIHDVRLRMIGFLIALEKYEEADRYLAEELKQAKAEYEEKSDSPDFVIRLANALQSRVTLREATGEDDLEDARNRQLVFLQIKAEAFPDHPGILRAYLDAHLAAINTLARSNPDQAAALLQKSKSFIDGIDSRERQITQHVMIARRSLPYLQRLVADGKRHSRLIDRDWTPPKAITWLNSDPLESDDFKGKVVLLDFWSVWCVPCLESFPVLSRWHEEYAEEDLVIVGVTRYYNYSWDEERQMVVKELERDVPQREERKVLGRFVDRNDLNYPIAITAPGSDFRQNYHVVSLPQTVLIDRQGRIRFIRVGTGPAITREIERKLVELLAEESEPVDANGQEPDAKATE